MSLDPKIKAEQIVGHFRMILMQEDTECGNEILCTHIAKKCSLLLVEEIKESRKDDGSFDDTLFQGRSPYSSVHPMYLTYWNQVEDQIKAI
jgi:hypothetical protein